MCTATNHIDVGFSQESFNPGTHICLVFRDEASRRRIVSKFVGSGLLSGEQVFYFADTVEPAEVDSWLENELGVEFHDSLTGESSTFRSQFASDTYYPDGAFKPEPMLETLKATYAASRSAGYPNVRVTGEMSWALRDVPGKERLIEYESAVNEVVKSHPVTAMCQYDANRFDGELIYQALRVHPYMVMNGQLVKNPYYA